jgi:D-alanyl-D-alanine carboxypeptidase
VTGFRWSGRAAAVANLLGALLLGALLLGALLLGASSASVAASVDDLVRAYPDALMGFDGANLIWCDGTRMPVGDGRPDKSMAEQLRAGSILDQLKLAYPAGAPLLPAPREDPGRVRNRAFFDKMYGDCRTGPVALVPVIWLPHTWGHAVSITPVNDADGQLAAVSRELDALPADDKKYLYPVGGTYTCRSVADAGQRSMHAWGAAIDINPAFSDYWLWHRSGGTVPAYANRVPLEVVTVFERHGFIWGGRWAHFDTMHFEYRPELLISPQSERLR